LLAADGDIHRRGAFDAEEVPNALGHAWAVVAEQDASSPRISR
jgi:hypothetical protein